MVPNGDISSQLARYLLQVQDGERLKSVRQLAQLYDASVGTISNALSSLESSGAVQIDRRGHLGSFIGARSLGALWMSAEQEPLVVSFPLIAHSRLEGLATALKKSIGETGIDVYLTFIRGSKTRFKALRENKCHIAVMSVLAAEELSTDSEQVALRLPGQSFLEGHAVFYRADSEAKGQPLRVAIDRDSVDVEAITEFEFAGQDVTFKPVTFMQLPRLLNGNYVDAGIWSIDDMRPHLSDQILYRPLSDHVVEHVGERDTAASLVARVDNTSALAVIERVMQPETILDIQRQVINGELVPEY